MSKDEIFARVAEVISEFFGFDLGECILSQRPS